MRGLNPYVVYGLIALAAVALIAAVISAIRTRQTNRQGIEQALTFRYSLGLRALAMLAAFGVPAGITVYILTTRQRNPNSGVILAAYVFFVVFGLPLFWETIRYMVRTTPFGIERRSAWSRYRAFGWEDVRGIRFNPYFSYFVVESNKGVKIRIHALVARLDEILQQIELNLPPAALTHARKGYERLGRTLPKIGNEPILEARPPRP